MSAFNTSPFLYLQSLSLYENSIWKCNSPFIDSYPLLHCFYSLLYLGSCISKEAPGICSAWATASARQRAVLVCT